MGEVDWVLPGAHRLRVDISLTNGISSSSLSSATGEAGGIFTNSEIYRSIRSILRDTFEWGDREPTTDIRIRRDKPLPSAATNKGQSATLPSWIVEVTIEFESANACAYFRDRLPELGAAALRSGWIATATERALPVADSLEDMKRRWDKLHTSADTPDGIPRVTATPDTLVIRRVPLSWFHVKRGPVGLPVYDPPASSTWSALSLFSSPSMVSSASNVGMIGIPAPPPLFGSSMSLSMPSHMTSLASPMAPYMPGSSYAPSSSSSSIGIAGVTLPPLFGNGPSSYHMTMPPLFPGSSLHPHVPSYGMSGMSSSTSSMNIPGGPVSFKKKGVRATRDSIRGRREDGQTSDNEDGEVGDDDASLAPGEEAPVLPRIRVLAPAVAVSSLPPVSVKSAPGEEEDGEVSDDDDDVTKHQARQDAHDAHKNAAATAAASSAIATQVAQSHAAAQAAAASVAAYQDEQRKAMERTIEMKLVADAAEKKRIDDEKKAAEEALAKQKAADEEAARKKKEEEGEVSDDDDTNDNDRDTKQSVKKPSRSPSPLDEFGRPIQRPRGGSRRSLSRTPSPSSKRRRRSASRSPSPSSGNKKRSSRSRSRSRSASADDRTNGRNKRTRDGHNKKVDDTIKHEGGEDDNDDSSSGSAAVKKEEKVDPVKSEPGVAPSSAPLLWSSAVKEEEVEPTTEEGRKKRALWKDLQKEQKNNSVLQSLFPSAPIARWDVQYSQARVVRFDDDKRAYTIDSKSTPIAFKMTAGRGGGTVAMKQKERELLALRQEKERKAREAAEKEEDTDAMHEMGEGDIYVQFASTEALSSAVVMIVGKLLRHRPTGLRAAVSIDMDYSAFLREDASVARRLVRAEKEALAQRHLEAKKKREEEAERARIEEERKIEAAKLRRQEEERKKQQEDERRWQEESRLREIERERKRLEDERKALEDMKKKEVEMKIAKEEELKQRVMERIEKMKRDEEEKEKRERDERDAKFRAAVAEKKQQEALKREQIELQLQIEKAATAQAALASAATPSRFSSSNPRRGFADAADFDAEHRRRAAAAKAKRVNVGGAPRGKSGADLRPNFHKKFDEGLQLWGSDSDDSGRSRSRSPPRNGGAAPAPVPVGGRRRRRGRRRRGMPPGGPPMSRVPASRDMDPDRRSPPPVVLRDANGRRIDRDPRDDIHPDERRRSRSRSRSPPGSSGGSGLPFDAREMLARLASGRGLPGLPFPPSSLFPAGFSLPGGLPFPPPDFLRARPRDDRDDRRDPRDIRDDRRERQSPPPVVLRDEHGRRIDRDPRDDRRERERERERDRLPLPPPSTSSRDTRDDIRDRDRAAPPPAASSRESRSRRSRDRDDRTSSSSLWRTVDTVTSTSDRDAERRERRERDRPTTSAGSGSPSERDTDRRKRRETKPLMSVVAVP